MHLPDHAERELFDWWLSCDNPSACRKYRARLVFGDPEGLRFAFHRELFVCSECGKPAKRDGRRPVGRDVYVIWGTDTQVATYLVAEGESLTVGAGPQAEIDVFREPGGIVSGRVRPTEQQRARVDALHCRIHCRDGQLTVTDLGSRHGTCVLRMRHAKVADVAALAAARAGATAPRRRRGAGRGRAASHIGPSPALRRRRERRVDATAKPRRDRRTTRREWQHGDRRQARGRRRDARSDRCLLGRLDPAAAAAATVRLAVVAEGRAPGADPIALVALGAHLSTRSTSAAHYCPAAAEISARRFEWVAALGATEQGTRRAIVLLSDGHDDAIAAGAAGIDGLRAAVATGADADLDALRAFAGEQGVLVDPRGSNGWCSRSTRWPATTSPTSRRSRCWASRAPATYPVRRPSRGGPVIPPPDPVRAWAHAPGVHRARAARRHDRDRS